MNSCWICLRSVNGGDRYHPRCLRTLFGTAKPPTVPDVDVARLHLAGLQMVGRTALSGVQRKISANLSGDRRTLHVALGPGRFILKPQSPTFPELPENELTTLRVAALAGVEIPPCGLLALADGTAAFISKRFDRPDRGEKLRQEDFCQLAGLRPKQKYEGSAELCARIVRRFATEPLVELLRLFRQMVCGWWTGHGDGHLKNFSLLIEPDGCARLSPAYDQVCTRLVIPGDPLALSVGGKRDGLTRRDWEAYGAYCGLPARSIARELARFPAALGAAIATIERAPISDPSRETYARLLRERTAALSAS